MSGLLEGKVAVVTGSTQGMGAAIAERFVREGARVALSGRSKEKGQALASALGARAVYHAGDLGRVEDCRELIHAARNAFGGIDILVNSAALPARSTLESFTPELFDEQFHLNLRAPLLLAQAALPSLRERKGVILNIGSVNAYVGEESLLLYAATKGALMTVSRNLANVFKYDRIRVYCLNVGWTDTEGERRAMAQLGKPSDFLEKAGRRFPIGRLIRPSEVAEACLFFVSEKATAFSGAVVDLEQFPIGTLHDPSTAKGSTQ